MKKAAVCGILALLLAGLAWRLARRPADLSAQSFIGGLPTLEPGLKLEIARLNLVETAAGESPKVVWGVDWGTTRAVISVPARIHFALDLFFFSFS